MSYEYEGSACREQAAREEQERRAKEARIVRVARADRELAVWAMVERFNVPEHTITRLLKANSLQREPEGIGTYRNGTRRRTG
jgi:hypothetical protein